MKRWTSLLLLVSLLLSAFTVSGNASAGPIVPAWTIEEVTASAGLSAIDLDGFGDPHISYYAADHVHIGYALRDGSGWHTQDIAPTGNSYGMTTGIDLDHGGYAHVCFFDPSPADHAGYAYQDAGGWHREDITTEPGTTGLGCSIAVDGSGRPHVAYHDNLSGPYPSDGHGDYAYKDASGWHLEPFDAQGEETHLALDSDGMPHIAYSDPQVGVKYAYRDAGGWHQEAIDTSITNFVRQPAIAIDSAGRPHIAYTASPAGIWHAYRDGSGWHKEMVDASGQLSSRVSLAVNSDDQPAIAYYDVSNKDLRYAYKDAGGWHPETVDSEGDVGNFPGLAMDSTGFPHISYYDATNGKLKYAFLFVPPQHTLSVSRAGSGSGFVSSNPPGIECGATCQATLAEGTVVALAASPDAGSGFGGWSGDADCSDGHVTLTGDLTCTATFTSVRAYVPLTWKR